MPTGPDRATDETRVISQDRNATGAGPRQPDSGRGNGRSTAPAIDPLLVVAVLAGVISMFMLVVGIVTLARTGLPAGDLTGGRTAVGPFDRSSLMGIIEILGGLAFASVAASRQSSTLTALGLVTTVFGLVWLIEPHAFGDALGINRATAWVYLLFGLASSVVGLWAPSGAQRVVVRR